METAVIILAAGKGTRMKSDLPKVLHPIAGKPMLWHVIKAAQSLSPAKTVVITGHGAEDVESMVKTEFPSQPITFARQTEQKGTGHATQQAESALSGFQGHAVVLYGDVMLNARPDVLPQLQGNIQPGTLTVLTADVPDPTGFGRIFHKNNQLVNVEEKDCSEAERKVTTANPGIYALPAEALWSMLAQLQPNNKQGEYYLTDIIALAPGHGLSVHAVSVTAERPEMGVNNRVELAAMEAHLQASLRKMHMLNGVTLADPTTVYFSTDTVIANDVTIGQNVVFGPGVTIASGVEIKPFCHLEGCTIGTGAHIGPFARLRPGSTVEESAHVGNFVELKNATLGAHSKAGHLSYLGDITIGKHANIGAGTIVANYKHKTREKFKTILGDNTSTGSHTTLVAPVALGNGATTGAGTVVRGNVEDGALIVSTPTQKTKSGYNI